MLVTAWANDLLAVGQARGELWQIDNDSLAACDRLKVHPHYRREEVPVILDADRSPHMAWTYIIAEPLRACKCLKKSPAGVLQWHDKPPLWGLHRDVLPEVRRPKRN